MVSTAKEIIFDIQRGSFVDGPGIRTTVFFKGCNLNCKWCHNPESQNKGKQILIYEEKCTGCGKCRKVCPNNFEKCDFCGKCAIYCPNDAREVCGREYLAEEILSEILKDKSFYGKDGGVTFSGGECMLQIDFLKELLVCCKENGIHTAVDTAGNVPWESFEKIIEYTDLFLYDVKSKGKKAIFESLGFTDKDSQSLKREIEKQSLANYLIGNYLLKNLDSNGQRWAIPITLSGKTFYTGWMLEPEGKIRNATPFGGWVK